MKTDRLLGILVYLSNHDKTTAPELAEYFEVSRRTINRDIESLCMAGVPIVTTQGTNGGIRIQDGYRMDQTIFTHNELSHIIAGLKAIGSIQSSSSIHHLLDKVRPDSEAMYTTQDHLLIDLSSFYKPSISRKIPLLQDAIQQSRQVAFTYYSRFRESQRIVDPHIVTFRWESWYLYAYCPQSADFRMFKLNRLWDLEITEQTFTPHSFSLQELDFDAHLTDDHPVEALFSPSVQHRLIDVYGRDCYTIQPDGWLHFKGTYTNYDFILQWLLSFGDQVTVLSPAQLAQDLQTQAENMVRKYTLQHDI